MQRPVSGRGVGVEAVGLTPCGVEGGTPGRVRSAGAHGLTLAQDMVQPLSFHGARCAVVEVDERTVAEDGYVDLGRAGTTAISGLDGYQTPTLGALVLRKVGKEVDVLTDVMTGWNDM